MRHRIEKIYPLPPKYTVEVKNSKISFVKDSDTVNDPVEEIATVEDCESQSVLNSMNAIGIASQYEATWTEAMQFCGNDICTQQCVEAVAAVPYMFGTRTDLDLNTTSNLMNFYLGSTAGISAEQADWLMGSTLTLTSVYQYLLSRDTELDCGYKSETGIAGRIAGAFIDERVALMLPATIDDFACTIEDYFYCVRDDYSRAELAFNAAMNIYEQYGSTCSMCAGTLSARGSVCPCEEELDVIANIMACTGAPTAEANEISSIVGTSCDGAVDYCECLIYSSIEINEAILANIVSVQGVSPVVNLENPLCPEMLTFTIFEPDDEQQSAGIRGITIELDINGLKKQYTISNLIFTSRMDVENCEPANTGSSLASNSVNAAIHSAAIRIGNGDYANFEDADGNPTSDILTLEKATILTEMNAHFRRSTIDLCAGHYSPFTVSVRYLNISSAIKHSNDHGTVFTLFSNLFSTLCP